MNNLYIAYDKFPCQYYLTTFFVISTLVSPRILSISLRNVLSRLFSHEKTHDMCFFTYLYAFTHSFLSAACLPASEMCFLTCSPLKKHMTCVFSLAYMLLHTVFSLLPAYQLPGCVFSPLPAYQLPECVFPHRKNAMRLGIPNAWRFINSKLILLFRLKGIHCRSTEAGTKVQSSSLLPRLQHRSRQSQPETSQSQAPYP